MDKPKIAERLIAHTVAPMFRETDRLSEQVSQGLLGEAAAVLEERGEWSRIRTPDTYEGWVHSGALVAAPAGWSGQWAVVHDLWANLRAKDDYRGAAVLQAPMGTRLPLVGESERWVQLLVPDGRLLWTEHQRAIPLCREPARPRNTGAMCRTARKFLDVPYLWGGCSPFGIDCSGFVQLVMGLHGVTLLRDAHMQAEQGLPVDDPHRGDLVFFGPIDRPGAITHVGMMLDRARFIHAAGSDRVRINRLTDERRGEVLRCVRRML